MRKISVSDKILSKIWKKEKISGSKTLSTSV